jgi:hypothetical protein
LDNKQVDLTRTKDKRNDKNKLRVINIGLLQFYDALVIQNTEVIHLDWQPPVERSQEINDLLDRFL